MFIVIIKRVIIMITWKDETLQKPIRSKVEQSKEGHLEIFLLLPVSLEYIYLNLNPNFQIFFTTKLSIKHRPHPFMEILNYYISEVEENKDILNDKLKTEEDLIEGAVTKEELENLLFISRNCQYLKTSLHKLTSIIDYIEKKTNFLQDYESLNLDITMSQLIYELDNIQAQVLTLTEVSDLIYSHRENSLIKRLTIFALVFSIPTFITSFYGMNVDLPFQRHPLLIFILFGVNGIITLFLLILIKYFEKY